MFNPLPHHVIEGGADKYSNIAAVNMQKGIYEATSVAKKKQVIFKIRLVSDQKGNKIDLLMKSFTSEAQICAMGHKHIVEIFDAFTCIYNGKLFGVIVM